MRGRELLNEKVKGAALRPLHPRHMGRPASTKLREQKGNVCFKPWRLCRQSVTPFLICSLYPLFLESTRKRWEQYLQIGSRREHGGEISCLAPGSSASDHFTAKEANSRYLHTIYWFIASIGPEDRLQVLPSYCSDKLSAKPAPTVLFIFTGVGSVEFRLMASQSRITCRIGRNYSWEDLFQSSGRLRAPFSTKSADSATPLKLQQPVSLATDAILLSMRSLKM